jgi:hypothetical protein
MQMAAGLGYQSDWAKTNLPGRKERNTFYTRIGRKTQPGPEGLEMLRRIGFNALPSDF